MAGCQQSVHARVAALILIGAAALLPSARAAHPAQFGMATNFPCGGFAGVLVAGDFNRDATPDVVVTSGGISFLPGRGGGGLGAPTNYASSMFGSGALATGDFNNDGKLDLLEADWYSTRIILGDGAGSLSVLTNMSGDRSFAVYPAAAGVGDLNGDGQLDIAIANTGNPMGRGVTIGFGRGDGFFGAPTSCALVDPPSDMALGDLDGDGRLDAAVSYRLGACVLTNRGDGTLAISRTYDSPLVPDQHHSLKLADFDGTAGLDMAVLNFNAQSVSIRLNNGHGVFGAATNCALGFQPIGLAAGDFNGDGSMDLVVRGDAFARVLVGQGNGAFTLGLSLPVASGVSSAGTVAVADFDTNGTPDLAFACYQNGSVAIRLNQTPPLLRIIPSLGYHQVTWRAAFGTGYVLESASNVNVPGNWQLVPAPPVLIGSERCVTNWSGQEQAFYRLRKL